MSSGIEDVSLEPPPPTDPRAIDAIGATLTQFDARRALNMPEQSPSSPSSPSPPRAAADIEKSLLFDDFRDAFPEGYLHGLDALGVFTKGDADASNGHVPVVTYYPFDAPDAQQSTDGLVKRLVVNDYTVPCPGRVVYLKGDAQRSDKDSQIVYGAMPSPKETTKATETSSADDAWKLKKQCEMIVVVIIRANMKSNWTLSDVLDTLTSISFKTERSELHIARRHFDEPNKEVMGRCEDSYTWETKDAFVFYEAPRPEGDETAPIPYISLGRYSYPFVVNKNRGILGNLEPQPTVMSADRVKESRDRRGNPLNDDGRLTEDEKREFAQRTLPTNCAVEENEEKIFLTEEEIDVFKKAMITLKRQLKYANRNI